MRFFKFIFKLIFFSAFAATVAGFFIAWANIWVPQDSVALLRVYPLKKSDAGESSASTIAKTITRKGFTWVWQRVIPGGTSLIPVETGLREYALEKQFVLENALQYAAVNGASISDFTLNASINVGYTPDTGTLQDYIINNKISDVYALERVLLGHVAGTASNAVAQMPVEISETTTAPNLENGIRAHIQTALARSQLPVVIQSVKVHITKSPNLDAYKRVKALAQGESGFENLAQNISGGNSTSTAFSSNKEALIFYLYFVQRLSVMSKTNPQITELVKTIPPGDILPQ